jgi:hypothetical protein
MGVDDAGHRLLLGEPSADVHPVRDLLQEDVLPLASAAVGDRLRSRVWSAGRGSGPTPGAASREARRGDAGEANHEQNEGSTLDLHRIFTEPTH